MTTRALLAIDQTITLGIDGSRQSIRLCSARTGLPPVLIVQGGPGLPLLHEVAKFQRLLNLEDDFLVAYWEQRGCGNASQNDAQSVSLSKQVDDLRTVLRWLHTETQQGVLMFGISWGATIVLQAVEHESDRVTSVVGISPDLQTTRSDAGAYAFLQEQSLRADRRRIGRRVMTLGRPPYLDLAEFQRRARLLADLGTVERGKSFSGLLLELLFGLIRTYGVVGGVRLSTRDSSCSLRLRRSRRADLGLRGDGIAGSHCASEQHGSPCARCRPHGPFRPAANRAINRGESMKLHANASRRRSTRRSAASGCSPRFTEISRRWTPSSRWPGRSPPLNSSRRRTLRG
jgi:pimeloyl-ACP methyl ester carboxylesterase